MQMIETEKYLARVLALGAAITSILVISGSVTDPVNAPKALALGIVGFSAFSLLLLSKLKIRITETRVLLSVCIAFVLIMFIGLFSSRAPLSQTLYGIYGRNTGLITYLSLVFLLLAASTLRAKSSFSRILNALIFAGLVNLIYCLWVLLFGDFIAWSNTYRNILGTFGNPNFIGSFLGIFLSTFIALIVSPSANIWLKRSAIIVIPVTLYEIIESNAIQGRVLAALGIGIVLFFYIREKATRLLLGLYTTLFIIAGTLSLLGALQIGPLTNFIYKTSVSLRGQYWLAGWETGLLNPLTGVGMDSFGDWYRRARGPHSLVLPGVNTIVNAAHNVYLDIFASGGWPLLAAYVLIQLLTIISIIRFTLINKNYDPIFVGLLVSWLGYQVQSLISINQIGLAIWGWILGGALIAYERKARISAEELNEQKVRIRKSVGTETAAPLFLLIGGLVGLLVALPPLSGDIKWRSAQLSRNALEVEKSLTPGYFNPANSMKYVVTIDLLESSNLPELAHKTALEAVEFNPESFELWKMLFLVRNSTQEEKSLALENMKRLDPLNPEVTA